MLFLIKEDIARSVDLNGMMDQIEEAYRIFGSGELEGSALLGHLSLCV